jgi:hypothetical protein
MRCAEWESFRRDVQFVEESLRRWIVRTSIVVLSVLGKQKGNNGAIQQDGL